MDRARQRPAAPRPTSTAIASELGEAEQAEPDHLAGQEAARADRGEQHLDDARGLLLDHADGDAVAVVDELPVEHQHGEEGERALAVALGVDRARRSSPAARAARARAALPLPTEAGGRAPRPPGPGARRRRRRRRACRRAAPCTHATAVQSTASASPRAQRAARPPAAAIASSPLTRRRAPRAAARGRGATGAELGVGHARIVTRRARRRRAAAARTATSTMITTVTASRDERSDFSRSVLRDLAPRHQRDGLAPPQAPHAADGLAEHLREGRSSKAKCSTGPAERARSSTGPGVRAGRERQGHRAGGDHLRPRPPASTRGPWPSGHARRAPAAARRPCAAPRGVPAPPAARGG